MEARILAGDEHKLRVLVYAALVSALFTALYLRLKNITITGFAGNDPCLYWAVAHEWARGNYILAKDAGYTFFRPSLFAFHAAALTLLGDKEYSLRALTAIFDVLNIGLVYAAGLRLSGSRFPGLFASVLYSLSPLALQNARTELAHAPSVTFMLAAILLFLAGIDEPGRGSRSRLFAFFSGTALFLAAGMHGDLACLGPGFVLGYGVLRSGTLRARIEEIVGSGLWFSLGFFFLVALSVPYYGATEILKGLTGSARFSAANLPLFPAELSFRIFTEGVARILSWETAVVFLLTIGAAIFLASGTPRAARAFLPLLLFASYALFFELLVSRNDVTTRLPRILIPLAPLVTLFIGVWGWELLRRISFGRLLIPLYLFSAGALTWGSFTDAAEKHVFSAGPTPYRKLYDTLGPLTGPDARVLIAPSLVTISKRCFQSSAYFGRDAVYLFDCTQNGPPLEQFAREQSVRYVYLANILLRPPSLLARRNPETCFGWEDDESYRLTREIETLQSFIASRNGRPVAFEPYFGEIFELEPWTNE